MWKEKIIIEGPYDFDRALRRLAFEPLFAVDLKEQSVQVPLWIRKKPIVAEVKGVGSVNRPRFLVSSDCGQKEAMLSRLRKIFKWNRPLAELSEHFALTDLKPLFHIYKGTPLVCEFDLYRALIKSIVHQQLNLKFANTLMERFVKSFGFRKEGAWFYPQPEKVAELSVDDLRRLQFSQRKAEYVIGTSKMIAEGALSLEDLREAGDEEVIKMLVKIRGIGLWTAESLLLFGLGRENLLPAADVGLQNAVKKLYGYSEKPKAEKIRELGKEWSPYRSYASLYLWESLGTHSVHT